jgi:hypothetical protein
VTDPRQRGPRRCPACGRPYGHEGVRCYPGVPQVRTRNGKGLAARCDHEGTLAVPPAMPSDIRGVVSELRSAGAAWEVVDAWLRKFGLARDPADAPRAPRGGASGPDAGGRPQVPRGPQPVPREVARPYTYGAQEPDSTSQVCPESTGPHGPLDGAGRCPWCKRKVGRALPAPRVVPPTELGQEYRRHHDPDWGTDHRDV